MSCVFRIIGEYLDIDLLVNATNLKPDKKRHKGDKIFSKQSDRTLSYSYISIRVSEEPMNEFEKQVTDTMFFLKENMNSIKAAVKFDNVEYIHLDFGVEKNKFCNEFLFRRELLNLVSEAGIEIRLSVY